VGKVFDCAPFALDSPNASTTRSIAGCASGKSALGFTFPQDKSARLISLHRKKCYLAQFFGSPNLRGEDHHWRLEKNRKAILWANSLLLCAITKT
jgi:hypothetical protein